MSGRDRDILGELDVLGTTESGIASNRMRYDGANYIRAQSGSTHKITDFAAVGLARVTGSCRMFGGPSQARA